MEPSQRGPWQQKPRLATGEKTKRIYNEVDLAQSLPMTMLLILFKQKVFLVSVVGPREGGRREPPLSPLLHVVSRSGRPVQEIFRGHDPGGFRVIIQADLLERVRLVELAKDLPCEVDIMPVDVTTFQGQVVDELKLFFEFLLQAPLQRGFCVHLLLVGVSITIRGRIVVPERIGTDSEIQKHSVQVPKVLRRGLHLGGYGFSFTGVGAVGGGSSPSHDGSQQVLVAGVEPLLGQEPLSPGSEIGEEAAVVLCRLAQMPDYALVLFPKLRFRSRQARLAPLENPLHSVAGAAGAAAPDATLAAAGVAANNQSATVYMYVVIHAQLGILLM